MNKSRNARVFEYLTCFMGKLRNDVKCFLFVELRIYLYLIENKNTTKFLFFLVTDIYFS